MVAQRESHGRKALHGSLADNTYRARIMRIDAGIVTMVDAADDKVRLAADIAVQGYLHTVGRRARTGIHFQTLLLPHKLHSQRRPRRERGTKARARPLRGYNKDVVVCAKHVNKEIDASCGISIII